MNVALKEWSAVCRALASGRQSILLRKGGIAEPDGDFRLEATRFLLYPTYVHQQDRGLRAEERSFLDDALRDRPADGVVRLEHWAEATGVYDIRDLLPAHLIAHLHVLADETVEKRFRYRRPGIAAIAVRVFRLPSAVEIQESEAQRGCKSWVRLESDVSLDGSTPVASDADHRDAIRQLDSLLRPTARA